MTRPAPRATPDSTQAADDVQPIGRLIAIDGPAASGKSTLGAALAERLGYTYVDSGAVYRAVTLAALRQGLAVDDGEPLAALAMRLDIQVTRPTVADGRQYTVVVDGEDVTWDLRSAAVDANVSAVSAHPGVRRAANALLRRLLTPEGTVMVGRDIGTVVLPDANLKLFLVASPEARAQRRCQELAARGLDVDYATILQEIYRRDAYDGGRATAPMRPADDAVILDTSRLSVAEELDVALRHLHPARPAHGQDSEKDEQ